MSLRSSQIGFSYIGVLILVAIIATATSAILVLNSTIQRRNAEEELLYVGSQYKAAFRGYYESTPSGQSHYPASLADLLKDPRYPNVRRYLRKIYIDPISGKDDWVPVLSPEGGIMGVHSASTDQPIKIALFPAEFEQFEGLRSYSDWAFFYK